MPFIINGSRRIRAVAAVLAGAGLLVTASAAQAATAANPLNCTPTPALKQPFAPWNDFGQYTLSPGGDFESLLSGWYVGPGAKLVAENESFYVGNAGDGASLSLPAGSSVVSRPICIDETYPWFRFFARNTGSSDGKLHVDVLYLDTNYRLQLAGSGDHTSTSTAWSPTGTMRIDMQFDPDVADGAAPVAFRFTAMGKGSSWRIDDLYVDPMARR